MKVLSLAMLFILTSCLPSLDKTTLVFDDGRISTKPLVADGEAVNFEVLKEKLLVPHCIACHKGAAQEEKILGWVVAGKPDDSELYQVIKDGSMPKKAAALDSRYLDLVVRYIESVKAPEVPTTPVVVAGFEEIKQKILVPHCLKCHEDVDNEKNLMEWITPAKPEESPFYVAIKSGEMPQESSPLSADEQALVEKYISSMKPVAEPEPEVEITTTFADINKDILVPKCLGCHKKMGDETLLISKWVTPGDPENSKMYKSVVNGSMPKKAERLSDKEIAAIASYIKSLKP
jgi:mono/diheme cytochrome c family protein